MAEQKPFNYQEDLISLTLLESYLPKKAFLPYTTSSLSFQSIRSIANDVVVNRRQRILEFGAGVSTLILASLLKELSPTANIVSADENADWVVLMTEMAKKESLENIQIIHCPLQNENDEGFSNWYDIVKLKEVATNLFDIILVDGPSAWEKGKSQARRPALEFVLKNRLIDRANFSIYLDDCNRKGESDILKEWGNTLGIKARMLSSSLGRLSAGDIFNTE